MNRKAKSFQIEIEKLSPETKNFIQSSVRVPTKFAREALDFYVKHLLSGKTDSQSEGAGDISGKLDNLSEKMEILLRHMNGIPHKSPATVAVEKEPIVQTVPKVPDKEIAVKKEKEIADPDAVPDDARRRIESNMNKSLEGF